MVFDKEFILVASIEKAHGIRGAVLVHSYCENPEDFLTYPLYTKNGQKIDLQFVGIHKRSFICHIEGIDDRTKAEAMRGIKLFAPQKYLPQLEQEEFYHYKLIGLSVQKLDGTKIGQVVAVQNYGASDLLYVKGEEFDEFIPFTKDFVPKIDFENNIIVIDIDFNPKALKEND